MADEELDVDLVPTDPKFVVHQRNTRDGWWLDLRITNPRTGARRRLQRRLKATSRREADLEAARMIATMERTMRAPKPKKRAAFSGLAARWLELHGPTLKPSTLVMYRQVVRVHLLPHFEDVNVRNIGTEDVANLRATLVRSGRAAKTCNNVIAVLGSLLESGKTWGYLETNPVQALKVLKLPIVTTTWWSPAESEKALAWVKEHRPHWHLWLLLALRTGLRFGELAALDWRDVMVKHRTPHLVVRRAWSSQVKAFQTPKSNRERRVPLSERVVAALNAVPVAERKGLVVPPIIVDEESTSPIRSLTAARKLMAAIAKHAGVASIRVHDLRHTFCSQLVSAGTDLNRVRQWAGHADYTTTLRYAHMKPLERAGDISVLDAPPRDDDDTDDDVDG